MGRPNTSFEKRQREQKKAKKRREKEMKKAEREQGGVPADDADLDPRAALEALIKEESGEPADEADTDSDDAASESEDTETRD